MVAIRYSHGIEVRICKVFSTYPNRRSQYGILVVLHVSICKVFRTYPNRRSQYGILWVFYVRIPNITSTYPNQFTIRYPNSILVMYCACILEYPISILAIRYREEYFVSILLPDVVYLVSILLPRVVYSQVFPPWRSCSGSAGAARTSSWLGSNAATCMSCYNSQSNSQSHHP